MIKIYYSLDRLIHYLEFILFLLYKFLANAWKQKVFYDFRDQAPITNNQWQQFKE